MEERKKGDFKFEPVFPSICVRGVATIFSLTYEAGRERL